LIKYIFFKKSLKYYGFIFNFKKFNDWIFIAVPVGPISILCIRKTLFNGFLSGFISGLARSFSRWNLCIYCILFISEINELLEIISSLKVDLYKNNEASFNDTFILFNQLQNKKSKIRFLETYLNFGKDNKNLKNAIIKAINDINKCTINVYKILKKASKIIISNKYFSNTKLKLINIIIKMFEKYGTNISEENYKKLNEIILKILENNLEFQNNLRNSKNGIKVKKFDYFKNKNGLLDKKI
jgi:hypothetical protein